MYSTFYVSHAMKRDSHKEDKTVTTTTLVQTDRDAAAHICINGASDQQSHSHNGLLFPDFLFEYLLSSCRPGPTLLSFSDLIGLFTLAVRLSL